MRENDHNGSTLIAKETTVNGKRTYLALTTTAIAAVGLGGLLVTTSGCGGGGAEEKRLNGAGSTFVFPMMSKWSSEYDKAKGVKVNYQSIGSGGGIKQMIEKTVDYGCTDGPMNAEQLQEAKDKGGEVVHVPLVMGAVVPAFNLPGVDHLTFSGPVLADIFLGKIKNWNDTGIQELNPDVKLPDKDIVVVHRSDGSGTTYIWVDYLAKVSPAWKEKVGVATSVKWPAGDGEKGNEGVAGRVKGTDGALGYIELIYALQNDIKFGKVKNKAGVAIMADLKSVTAAADAALTNIPDDLRYSITDAEGKESYPISGTVWAVVYVSQPADKAQVVVEFLRWCLHDGQKFTDDLHYSKLPAGLVEKADKKLDLVKAAK
jgi:phosphate ABC transporter phosphate-binding protein